MSGKGVKQRCCAADLGSSSQLTTRFKDFFQRLVFLAAFGAEAEVVLYIRKGDVQFFARDFLFSKFTDVLNTDAAIDFLITGKRDLPEEFRDLSRGELLAVGIHELNAV